MKITFYKYNGENNRLNKTLENGVTIECNFNQAYYKNTPRIKLGYKSGEFDFNYCYIEDNKKYYFIDSVIETRNNYIECTLTIDVLMTYKDEILNLYGTVTQSTNYNYLDGANIPQTSNTKIETITFKNNWFREYDEAPFEYILVGVGSL